MLIQSISRANYSTPKGRKLFSAEPEILHRLSVTVECVLVLHQLCEYVVVCLCKERLMTGDSCIIHTYNELHHWNDPLCEILGSRKPHAKIGKAFMASVVHQYSVSHSMLC